MLEQQQRRLVGPVQVVEHEHERADARGSRAEERGHALEQPEPLGVAVERRRGPAGRGSARAAPSTIVATSGAPAPSSARRSSSGPRAHVRRGTPRRTAGTARRARPRSSGPSTPARRGSRRTSPSSSTRRVLPMPGSPTTITSRARAGDGVSIDAPRSVVELLGAADEAAPASGAQRHRRRRPRRAACRRRAPRSSPSTRRHVARGRTRGPDPSRAARARASSTARVTVGVVPRRRHRRGVEVLA